jgi:hypothetical protein
VRGYALERTVQAFAVRIADDVIATCEMITT